MQQPAFWYHQKSLLGHILRPLGFFYGFIVKARFYLTKPYTPKIPVICVGNINVGGCGKTPLCLALAEYFKKRNKKAYFLNHGYHSKLQNILIDKNLHTSKEVSDEALLLADKLPTIVNRNRAQGVQKAQALGAELVIMDDGFQNPSIKKTCSLLVFDGLKGIGNGACLPIGPLRESLKQGLNRADAVVIVGKDKHNLEETIRHINPQMPILHGHIEPIQNLNGKKGIAFAGIASPFKFFDMLEEKGALLSEKIVFNDHHAYTSKDIEMLLSKNETLLTTRKDAVKLDNKLNDKLLVVDINFILDNEKEWIQVLERKIK